MHNKYKVNYREDINRAKIKRIISIIFMLILIIALLVFTICYIYTNIHKINKDNLVVDTDNTNIKVINDNNTSTDNNNNEDIDNNTDSNNNITNDDEKVNDETNDEINAVTDLGDKPTDDKKEFVYGEKVPESEAVTNEYFDDALFIGNSQVEGISIYSSMKNATIYAGKGIMVDTIFTKEVIKTEAGTRITIIDALSKKQFKKVYIMLGANELGWAYDYLFIEQYGKVIDEIKKLQPEAKIYVNSIIPVSKEKTENDKIYNNKNIESYNKLILNMTKEKEVYYIDSKEALADEDGNLPEDAGTDGIHFNAKYYEQWFNYLKTHTVK